MKKFVMLGVILLGAGPALAQTQAPAAIAPAPRAPSSAATNSASASAWIDQRIAQMHQRLKITPEQEPAWQAFAQVMRDNMTSIEKAYADRRASVATMSAPDNMRDFAQIEQERAAGIQKLAGAFQTLYETMSDDQKKIADGMFRHYEIRGPRHKQASK
jgi:periplasmic protein CpxP/Spy